MQIIYLILAVFLLLPSAEAQSFPEFRSGYYTDANGEKHPGLIKYNYDYRRKIKFKTSTEGKVKTLRPEEIKGFVVAADSFIVLRNFYNEGVGGGEHLIDIDFVQVIVAGPLTLVKHYSTQGSGSTAFGAGTYSLENYLLLVAPYRQSTLVKKRSKKRFKTGMAAYFKNQPEIVERIEKQEYTWKDMPELVREYNKQMLAKKTR